MNFFLTENKKGKRKFFLNKINLETNQNLFIKNVADYKKNC